MPADRIALCTVAHDGGTGRATIADRTLTASTSGSLWQAVADASPGDIIYLGVAEAVDLPGELALAATQMAGAAIGRVASRDGSQSARVASIASRRFLNTPAGTLLVRRDALARAGRALRDTAWDDFWTYDLVNHIHRTGSVRGSDCTFATVAVVPAVERVPIARASPWLDRQPAEPLILIYGAIEASVSLYFDGLPEDLRARLRYLEPGDLATDLGWLASAALVIVVREFEHMYRTGTLDLLDEIGIPYVWFTDDDLVALGREVGSFRFYSQANVRRFVARARAVIATTAPLAEAIPAGGREVLIWPCVYDADLALGARPAPEPFRIGVFGGPFRHDSLYRDVLPAVAALRQPVEVHVRADLATRDAPGIVRVPFEHDFRAFIFDWQRRGLRALVHPLGATGNIANKSLGSVLAAAYIGAVPIVGDEPAYAGLGEAEGVLKATTDWRDRLHRLADPREAERLFAALDAWCRAHFDPENARAPFARLAAHALPGGEHRRAIRWQRACESRTLRRILAMPPIPRMSWWHRAARAFRRDRLPSS